MNKYLRTSDYLILLSAILSMIMSIYMWFSGFTQEGLFIGIWVPSILAFGIYFKIISVMARG